LRKWQHAHTWQRRRPATANRKKKEWVVGFFELGTAENMLAKAKRELARLETTDSTAEDSIDHVFNFFATAYHICDYLPKKAKKAAKKDPLIKLCGDACNTAKHMELDPDYGRPPVKTPRKIELGVDKTVERRIVWQDGTSLEIISFARKVIEKWEELFVKHGIGQPPT
jgi:hypothetical protein